MDRPELLRRLKSALQAAFGERLKGVVLYGSEARGEAGPDSDVDVLVLLSGPLQHPGDLWACIHATYPLTLELGRPVHAKPVDVDNYNSLDWPLYREVRREGIPA